MSTVESTLYRYPGAKPFEASEAELFRGRTDDIENLYELVSLQNLVVLYGRSGLGKSSLLNAGLSERFKNEPATIPVFIRFGAYYKGSRGTPFGKVYGLIPQQADQSAHFIFEKLIAKEEIAESRLWYGFKSGQLTQPGNKQFVLIFDQFEELFTYPQRDIELFKKELADLLYTSVPQQLRNLLKDKLRLNPHYLSEEEKEALFSPLRIKLLFSIRSDKLSLLNHLTDYFPSLLKWCYELKPLQAEQARQAIEEPALLEGSQYIAQPFRFTGEAVDKLLTSLMAARNAEEHGFSDQAHEIETFQLQLVCKHAENLVIEKKLQLITAGDLGNIKAIFENHYRNIIDKLAPAARLPARKLIEEKLIIDGNRVSMPIPAILKDPGMTPALLDELIGTHMLRREQKDTVELSHDTLIEPVLKYYEERKEEEATAAERKRKKELKIKRRKEEQKRLREQQLRAKRNRVLIAVISAALVVSLGLFAYAWNKSNIADRQKEDAIHQRQRADSIARVAKKESEYAFNSEQRAINMYRTLETTQIDLDAALQEANEQERIAVKSARQAAIQAQLAKNALEEAKTQKEIVAKNGKAFELITLARQTAEENPTVALRIAEAAMHEKNDSLIKQEAHKIFDMHAFYKTILRYSAYGRPFPDASKMLTLYGDGIEITDAAGNIVKSISSKPDYPYATAISPDGTRFVIGCDDSTARLYDLDGNVVAKFRSEQKAVFKSLAFSPDGKKIAAGFFDSSIYVWKTDGTLYSKFVSLKKLNTVSFSPDGTKILTGSTRTNPWLWDTDGKKGIELTGSKMRYSCGTFSPDGTKVLTGNLDSTIRLFSTKSALLLKEFPTGSEVSSVTCSPDGTWVLAGCTDKTAKLFSIDGTLLKEFKDHVKEVSYVAFSPDGSKIYTSAGSIRVWNVDGIALQKIQATTLKAVDNIDFSPDASSVFIKGFSDSLKSAIQLVDLVAKNRVTFSLTDTKAISMTFSPDGKKYLAALNNGIVQLRKLDGSLIREFATGGDVMNFLTFSPDGSKVITGHTHSYTCKLTVWSTEGKQLNTFEDPSNAVFQAVFSPDGKHMLISLGNRHRLSYRLVLLSLGDTPFKEFTGLNEYIDIHAAAFSKDASQILIGCSNGSVKLLDTTGKVLMDLPVKARSPVDAVAFSPDGSKLITGSTTVARLWSKEGKLIFEYKNDRGYVKAVTFSPDGARVMLGLSNGTVQTYTTIPALEDLLKSDRIDRLTPEQKKSFGIR